MFKTAIAYWKYHIGQLLSVMLSLILGVAGLMCAIYFTKAADQVRFDSLLDANGAYNYQISDVSEKEYDELLQSGLLEKAGKIYAGGICEAKTDNQFYMGCMDKNAIELYHHPCAEGHYPEKEKEITATRSVFEGMGVVPEIGKTVNLTVWDSNHNKAYEGSFVISGILKNLKNERKLTMGDQMDQPKVFFHDSFFGNTIHAAMNLLAIGGYHRSNDELLQYLQEHELMYVDIPYYYNAENQMLNVDRDDWAQLDYNGLKSMKNSSSMDFDSTVIIPCMTLAMGLMIFFAIFSSMYDVIEERKRSIQVYRRLGMSRVRAFRMILYEAFCIIFVGLGLGVLLGYMIMGCMKNILLAPDEFSSIIDILTWNPYSVSLPICGITALLAVAWSLIPINPKQRKIVFQTRYHYLKHILFPERANRLFIVLTLFLVLGCLFFGMLYLWERTDNEADMLQADIEERQVGNFDYLVEKDFQRSTALGQANRHSGGVSYDTITALSERAEVKSVKSCIQAKSTMTVHSKSDEKVRQALNDVWMYATDEDSSEYADKVKKHHGYKEDENLYNIATVGVDEAMRETLKPFVTKGAINQSAIHEGKEVIIIIDPDNEEVDCPYSVGDTIHFSDVVIEESDVEEFDFSKGDRSAGKKPAFQFEFLGEMQDGYAFGRRTDWEVKVGAIINPKDLDDIAYYMSDSISGDIGFNFISDPAAFKKWGLPDRNATLVGVELNSETDNKQFTHNWCEIMGTCHDISIYSVDDIRDQIMDIRGNHVWIFMCFMVVLLLVGASSIINTIQRSLTTHRDNIKRIKSMGISTYSLFRFIIIYLAEKMLISMTVAWIPVYLFIRERKIIWGGNEGSIDLDTAWKKMFPVSYDFTRHPIIATYVIMAVFILIVISIMVLISARKRIRGNTL